MVRHVVLVLSPTVSSRYVVFTASRQERKQYDQHGQQSCREEVSPLYSLYKDLTGGVNVPRAIGQFMNKGDRLMPHLAQACVSKKNLPLVSPVSSGGGSNGICLKQSVTINFVCSVRVRIILYVNTQSDSQRN